MTGPEELQNLYRQTVLEHSRHPRNFGKLATADLSAEGYNPLCGDKISVFLQVTEGTIDKITFDGVGCAISLASASIMTEQLNAKTVTPAHDAVIDILRQFTHRNAAAVPVGHAMAALGGVRAFPSRIKCATLPWKTLEAALDGRNQSTTTEE